jgi:hypothetical protein
MSVSTATQKAQDLEMHDPAGTFFAYVWFLFTLAMALGSAFLASQPDIDYRDLPFADGSLDTARFYGLGGAALFPVATFFFLVARAKTKGVRLSIEDESITYPGGGVAAASIFSYFTPAFWLQATKTHTTKFEDITQMNFTIDRTIFNKSQGGGKVDSKGKYTEPKYRYGVGIQGMFGAATIFFRNEQKADQLYGMLRQCLRAGIPVIDGRG